MHSQEQPQPLWRI